MRMPAEPETRAEIMALAGHTDSVIAQFTGLAPPTVSRIREEAKITGRTIGERRHNSKRTLTRGRLPFQQPAKETANANT